MKSSLDLFSLTHRIFLVKNYYQEFGNYSCVKSNYEDHYGFSDAPAFSEVALQEVISLFEGTGSVRRNPLQDITKPVLQEIRKDRNSERVNLSSYSLKCEICRKSFLYLSNLKRHILDTHELEDAYKCHICSADLKHKHKFLRHMKSHEEAPEAGKTLLDKFQQCTECGKMCLFSNYQEHILIHVGVQNYKCNRCGKEFIWQGAYKIHKMKHEGVLEKRNWPHCLICGQEMAGQRTLKLHMEKVHPAVNEDVKHCPDEVERVEVKIEEETPILEPETPHTESIVALPLDVDPLSTMEDPNEDPSNPHDDSSDYFPEEEDFAEDKPPTLEGRDQTNVKDEVMSLCELCGKVLLTQGLRKHLTIAHSHDQPYKCPVEGCNKAYKWSSSYQWHVMSHDNTKDRRYKCGICDKSFHYSYLRKNHIKEKHRDEADYCEHCDIVFTEKSEFMCHLREYHNVNEDDLPSAAASKPPPSKPLPSCMICGKIFKYRQNIKTHMRSHAKGEEALKCPEPGCGKSFPIQKYLALHMLRHSGQRFKCAHCDKDYADHGQLKTHIKRMHLNEKPKYLCGICDYGSWHSGSFRTHVKREHGIENPFPKRNLKYGNDPI